MNTQRVQVVGDADTQAISNTLAVILRGLLDLSRIWINKIQNQYGRETLLDIADTFKKVVSAIADADPNDREQVKKIIDEFLTDSGFLDNTKQELIKKIEQLKDERLRGVLLPALPVAFDVIKILFDENPANEEQIKTRLKELMRGPGAADMLTNILLFVISDRATAVTIASLILSIIGGVLKVEEAA